MTNATHVVPRAVPHPAQRVGGGANSFRQLLARRAARRHATWHRVLKRHVPAVRGYGAKQAVHVRRVIAVNPVRQCREVVEGCRGREARW